mmetsp:Transcript_40514/g.39022  ORF Transcript_40514/g.39022 Transcript_40514/m.39022 type:complete len:290 (-) Transcript_40514:1483-2352(-)
MAMIVLKGGYHAWPELLKFLTENLQSQMDQSVIENSIMSIQIIVEDCQSLFEEKGFESLIEFMVPSIFNLLQCNQTESVKSNAISTINILLLTQAPFLISNMDNYTKYLLGMRNEPSLEVRWRIVQGITNIMELRIDLIITYFHNGVLDLILTSLKEGDQKLALSATEFLSGIAAVNLLPFPPMQQAPSHIHLIKQSLPQILPGLLECCRFTEADQADYFQGNDNPNVSSKKKGQEEEEEEGEYEIGEQESFTTLRKSAAFALERFSKIYHEEVFFILNSHLESYLKNS